MGEGKSTQTGLFIPNFGELADPRNLVDYAVAAEKAGWDGLFLADHLIDFAAASAEEHRSISDPWTELAGIATRTERITLGSYVTPIARRQPWQLARNLATLDHLSDGRTMLGAGLGTSLDYTRFGTEYDPPQLAARYDEALEIVDGLWTGQPFSFEGDYYTLDDAVLRPPPVQEPRIPILIGGWWPNKGPILRGARWDGIMPLWPAMLRDIPNVVIDDLGESYRKHIRKDRSHEEEIRSMLGYYHDITDEPGEIVLQVDFPSTPAGFGEICRQLGVTWLLNSPVVESAPRTENLERIRRGPRID